MLDDNPELLNAQPGGRWSALHQFAAAGNVEAVSHLLKLGADPSAKTTDGRQPVDVAHPLCASLLGGDLTADQQHWFLDLARNLQFDEVRKLVRADPRYAQVQVAGRWTALHQAASAGDRETVALLVEKGANVKAKTKDGRTPLDVSHLRVRREPSFEALLGGGRKRQNSIDVVLERRSSRSSSGTEGTKEGKTPFELAQLLMRRASSTMAREDLVVRERSRSNGEAC